MYKIENGTVIDSEGKTLFFSVGRFIQDICFGDNCFICGKSLSDTEFNNEHVLPRWILKKYNLYKRKIILPNNSDFRYDRYVIPCCLGCNELMNQEFEQPIKKLVEGGYNNFIKYLKKEGPWKIFIWLNILFLKTHLKDKSLKLHLRSADVSKISDFYTWEELHHIHCVARSFYTNADLDSKVLGSLLVLPIKELDYFEHFDYADIYDSKSVLIRLNDIALISVLNDSCFSQHTIPRFIEKIDNNVSPLQIKEIFARLSFANMHLKNRPEYFSDIDILKESYKISATVPSEVEMDEFDLKKFGKLMLFCCDDLLDKKNKDEYDLLRQNVERGNYTFILDSNDNFISNSMDQIDENTV